MNVPASLQSVIVPDLWQQQAVAALRAGRDVIVQAPTGSGKTLIFELWTNQGRNRGQAIYTVPTRALANDKLAEWRARGWDVGIATGDIAENLSAPILVATLETQKGRLIQGDGPALLVVDEYQMLGDPDRGLNYELALALAPSKTRLLLLSGSVANPQQVVQWLQRLGRDAVLVRHEERPVPLEETFPDNLRWHLPRDINGYWPRFCAKALADDLGPILLFAPRRQSAEEIAADIARQLPCPNPLQLTEAQRRVVGDHLARLLKARVAYHHSGLSYAIRAGVIEPLAKAGQLRAVVATMGLAAGINFSLRSVAVTAATYRRDRIEVPLKPDEVLQMFGRAGRRGLDETGYVLVSANELRLRDAHPCHLARTGMVDWPALLGLMAVAADHGKDPFPEAARVQERLFTTKPIILGVEFSLKSPNAPCGLKTDAERARHVRKRNREFLNSHGAWEPFPALQARPLRDILTYIEPSAIPAPVDSMADAAPSQAPASSHRIRGEAAVTFSPSSPPGAAGMTPAPSSSHSPTLPPLNAANPADTQSQPPAQNPPSPNVTLRSVLTEPRALEHIGTGGLAVVGQRPDGREFGRSLIIGERLPGDRVILAKWLRRLTGWHGRETDLATWRQHVVPLVESKLQSQRFPVIRIVERPSHVVAYVSLADQNLQVPVDSHGVALWKPTTREVLPSDCAGCSLRETCQQLPTGTGTALLWRRLNLVDSSGTPTQRGRIVSFFSGGDGLAIAAGVEEESYPLDDFVHDLANLDAGFRFCGDDNRWGGRLAAVCQQRFGHQLIPGYLENGVPPKYGAGAETVVRSVHKDPASKARFITPFLGDGDIDRVIIEWRSLMRQIAHAPELDNARWTALQAVARTILHETRSPTETNLPPLDYHQTKRIDHRLDLRRH